VYVLRHEIIALHGASAVDGAQNYPQCVNLNVTGGGTREVTGGKSATQFYGREDKGVVFNVYGGATTYPFPGPELWK
jgi:cellulase